MVGARVYEHVDFEGALSLLARGAIPADALITDVVELQRAPEAFAQLVSGEAMKVLVDCGAS
jgi:threonine dehydrogenase-like Zn-dependent dehydrogenase